MSGLIGRVSMFVAPEPNLDRYCGIGIENETAYYLKRTKQFLRQRYSGCCALHGTIELTHEAHTLFLHTLQNEDYKGYYVHSRSIQLFLYCLAGHPASCVRKRSL